MFHTTFATVSFLNFNHIKKFFIFKEWQKRRDDCIYG